MTYFSGSDDRTVLVWDLKSDSSIQQLKGHVEFVTAVSFSPNSQYLATADSDGNVIIWSIKVMRYFYSPITLQINMHHRNRTGNQFSDVNALALS